MYIDTGSSRGIGAAIAEVFAKQGALLSITGRNKDKLSEVAKKCKENGSKQVLETVADLTKEEDMNKLMEETIKTFGKLDVLVNNAGMLHSASVEDYTGESFDKILAINLKAPIYLTKIAKPHLVLTKGNIVNMSSVSATRPFEGSLMYGITKSGLNYFTKTTAAS
ncbi:putative oxidoreductase SSP0419 [Ciona intestinalis]